MARRISISFFVYIDYTLLTYLKNVHLKQVCPANCVARSVVFPLIVNIVKVASVQVVST